MSIVVGQQAPSFTLVSTERKEVSLEDFKGRKVVIHFFPFAFTSVCTEQLCTMRDSFSYYEGVNAQILGISVDSPFTLAKFKEEMAYSFRCYRTLIRKFPPLMVPFTSNLPSV